MSTRCNILIKDRFNNAWVYRHTDGYIKNGAGDELISLCKNVFFAYNADATRGWYHKDNWWDFNKAHDIATYLIMLNDNDKQLCELINPNNILYRLTNGLHEDIDYLYTIDIVAKTLYVEDELLFKAGVDQLC